MVKAKICSSCHLKYRQYPVNLIRLKDIWQLIKTAILTGSTYLQPARFRCHRGAANFNCACITIVPKSPLHTSIFKYYLWCACHSLIYRNTHDRWLLWWIDQKAEKKRMEKVRETHWYPFQFHSLSFCVLSRCACASVHVCLGSLLVCVGSVSPAEAACTHHSYCLSGLIQTR